MRVLYVEDNPANVFLVKRVAKMGKHEIINYIDGGQALKKFDDINPDLVLMDIQLAGEIGGLDVVRELRGRGVKVPIIAVTAYAMVGDKERCLAAGCDDYLAKPLPVPRLVEIFQEYSAKVTTIASRDEQTVLAPPPIEEKQAEPKPKSKDDETVVSASQIASTAATENVESQAVAAENSNPQVAEDTKQAASDTVEQTATETSADTVEANTAQVEQPKAATGKLSEEATLPANAQEEAEIPENSSKPSSNT